MKNQARGKLGCACKLPVKHGLAAAAITPPQREFMIPEIAVNGIIMGTGLIAGILGWNNQDKPIGRLLLGAGGGLTALGIAFLIREIFTKGPD